LGDLALDKKEQSLSTNTAEKWTAFSVEVNPLSIASVISCSCVLLILKRLLVVLSCLGIPADQCKIDGVDVQTHWKISKQWQHDFALAYVNGKTSLTRNL
jgi:iron complex outermembrane receptor protein